MSQKVSNIDCLQLYNVNDTTNVTDFEVSISLDGENYQTIGKYSGVEWEQTHYNVDLSEVTLEDFRYVKLHLINGNTGYGYQIREFAVMGKDKAYYPEVKDQTSLVSSSDKNLALNKTVYMCHPQVKMKEQILQFLQMAMQMHFGHHYGMQQEHSEYVVIDLGKEVEPSLLSKVLVNFKISYIL